jgi:sacsin
MFSFHSPHQWFICLQGSGMAFCFLPLPLRTGLPIHVNGAFELSSNRRDLWNDMDLTGDGAERGRWNNALLKDAVARAYIQLLVTATRILGSTEAFYRLWPVAEEKLGDHWSLLSAAVLDRVVVEPVVWADTSMWLAPMDAVFVLPPADAEQALLQEEVAASLLHAGMPLAGSVPRDLAKELVRCRPELRLLSPRLLRHELRREGRAGLRGLLEGEDRQVAAELLLRYCLSDLEELERAADGGAELEGLSLIPMADGSLATLRMRGRDRKLLLPASQAQRDLFAAATPGSLVGGAGAAGALGHRLSQLAKVFPSCNVQPIDVGTVAGVLLPAVLPSGWRGQREAFSTVEEAAPSLEWFLALWGALDGLNPSEEEMRRLAEWPVIPVSSFAGDQGHLELRALSLEAQIVVEGSWAEPLVSVLRKSGCAMLEADVLNSLPAWARAKVHPATAHGVLAALGPMLASNAEPEEVDELRSFLLQARWFDARAGLDPGQVALLKRLPVFRCCGSSSLGFRSLTSDQQVYVAPKGVPIEALPSSFIAPASAAEADVLVKVGRFAEYCVFL